MKLIKNFVNKEVLSKFIGILFLAQPKFVSSQTINQECKS
jgi:hypothetical protein